MQNALRKSRFAHFSTKLASLCVAAALYAASCAQATPIFGYGVGVFQEGFVSFDSSTPGTRTIIAATDGAPIHGLTFDLSGSTLYGINDFTKTLETINTSTGGRTVVTTLSGLSANYVLSGISFNPLTGALFLSQTTTTASELYTINMATGVASLLGNTGVRGIIDIAFDPLGNLFATDIGTDSLFSLNTTTGTGSLVGALGFDMNFAQGMDFDFATGTLFAALYAGGGIGQWSTINTSTGAATFLAPLGLEMEIAIASGRGVNPVPTPGTLVLLGLGLAGLGLNRRRKPA